MVYRLLTVNFSPSNPSPSPCFIFLPEPAKLSLTTLAFLILKLSLRKPTIAHELARSNYNPVHGDSRLINNRVEIGQLLDRLIIKTERPWLVIRCRHAHSEIVVDTGSTCCPTRPHAHDLHPPCQKGGPTTRARRKFWLNLAKGFRGRRKNCYRLARPSVEKSLVHAYRGRKLKKRNNRKLWITRINAGVRAHDLTYSRVRVLPALFAPSCRQLSIHYPLSGRHRHCPCLQFMCGLKETDIGLDRKILSGLAAEEPLTFKALTLVVGATYNPANVPAQHYSFV